MPEATLPPFHLHFGIHYTQVKLRLLKCIEIIIGVDIRPVYCIGKQCSSLVKYDFREINKYIYFKLPLLFASEWRFGEYPHNSRFVYQSNVIWGFSNVRYPIIHRCCFIQTDINSASASQSLQNIELLCVKIHLYYQCRHTQILRFLMKKFWISFNRKCIWINLCT